MKANQLMSHTIDIKDLLLSVKSASSKYRIYLEEESLKKGESEAENKKAVISDDMVKLKVSAM